MKKFLSITIVCLLCLGIAFWASCLTSQNFTETAELIRHNMYPAELTTRFKLRFGPMMILAAKLIVNHTVDTPEISKYLQGIQKVQVGAYDIEQKNALVPRAISPTAEKQLIEQGWEPFVRARDREQQVSLFYKYEDERVCGVYVIVLNREQLVLFEAQGHFEQIVKSAFDNGWLQRESGRANGEEENHLHLPEKREAV